MSRDDLTRIEGEVIDVLAGGNFSVRLSNGASILAKLSGRMRKFSIRVILGDKVTVGISPYDVSHGLILSREKLEPRRRT
jgi:translation initiation factor IF-1